MGFEQGARERGVGWSRPVACVRGGVRMSNLCKVAKRSNEKAMHVNERVRCGYVQKNSLIELR